MKSTLSGLLSTGSFMGLMVLSFLTLSYCSGNGKEKGRKSLNNFKAYVAERKEHAYKYTDKKWDELESDYSKQKEQLEKDMDKMDEEMKRSYQNALAEWEDFKNDYYMRQQQISVEEEPGNNVSDKLLSMLVPSGVRTDLANIGGGDIEGVYRYFVKTVDKNRDLYSKEEWVRINNYWKRLNHLHTKLDEVGAISDSDDKKINGHMVKYVAIRALNKPFSDSEKQK